MINMLKQDTVEEIWGRHSQTAGGKPTIYLPNHECEVILKESCQALGVTHYAMAKLLGVRTCNYSQWFNGTRRPSSKYFAKIAKLHALKAFGMMINFVDHIDWDAKEVVYKKGVRLGDARGRDPIYKFSGGIPQTEGQSRSNTSDSGQEQTG